MTVNPNDISTYPAPGTTTGPYDNPNIPIIYAPGYGPNGPTGQANSTVIPRSGASLAASYSAGSSPLASGFPMLAQMIDYMLRAQAEQRAGRDQSINLARLMVDLERVSPTRAAALAASFGVKPNSDFSFTNLFGSGANFPLAGGGRVRGTIGGVSTSLPSVLSGQELSFMGANPNVARVVRDVADALGVPDIFERSMAARLPSMGSIFAGGF